MAVKINSISTPMFVVEENAPQPEAFAAVLLYLQEILKEACAKTTTPESSIPPTPLNLELCQLVKERHAEILQQKEHWRPHVDIVLNGNLVPISAGCGGAYFLIEDGSPRYVVKPVDESIHCLNNPKGFSSPFNDTDHRARAAIPLYRSAQTDALSSDVATLAGLANVTPEARMAIVDEKLASIQEYIPDTQGLSKLLHSFYKAKMPDDEIAACFDQKDYEEACMFLWLTYDNDGNASNFLTYIKRIENGKKIYGIKKIDNSLSFPETNRHYVNTLTWLPSAALPLSAELKQKIADLPIGEILSRMDKYEMTACKQAFVERIEIIQELAKREGMTSGEINLRLMILSHGSGKETALSTLTTQEILELLQGESPHEAA
jgi:hypothetical protein